MSDSELKKELKRQHEKDKKKKQADEVYKTLRNNTEELPYGYTKYYDIPKDPNYDDEPSMTGCTRNDMYLSQSELDRKYGRRVYENK